MRVPILAHLAHLAPISLISLIGGCLTDPPYRPYATQPASSGYSSQPAPSPSEGSASPASPSPVSPVSAAPATAGPAPSYPTYQTQLGESPPGAAAAPTAPTGAPAAKSQPPAPTATGATARGSSAPPPFVGSASPAGPQGGAAPPPAPAPTPLAPTIAGRYVCWISGAGMYAQSGLGTLTLDYNLSYTSTASTVAGGTYRQDGTRVLFAGGPIAGYVGSLETNSNGPLMRFRVDHPNDPGPSLRIGDHVCYRTR